MTIHTRQGEKQGGNHFYISSPAQVNLKGSTQSPTLQNDTSKIKGHVINKGEQPEDLGSNKPILENAW